MSRIDDLIARLCPQGVGVQPLGEVGEFLRGNGLQKKDLVETGIGCIHYGQVFTLYGTSTSFTESFVAPDLGASLRKAQPGDLVVATTSENDEDVCKAVAWLGEADIVISGDAHVYRHTLDPLFAAYAFQTDAFRSQKQRYISGTKVRRVSGGSLARITVPVPPLAVQREVVKILSKLESLEAELGAGLQAELEARQQHHEHYRHSLLAFERRDGIRWATLGELADIGTGSRNSNEALAVGAYPFFVRSQDVRYMDTFEFDETAIITSGDGVGVGKVFHFVDGKYALHQRAYRIRITSPDLLPKFFFHYMRNGFREYMQMTAVHSSVTSVRKPMLEKYPVPIPPLDEQAWLVTTLDRFDALVSELSVELPAERRARRQQYTHYRDRLLSFDQAAA